MAPPTTSVAARTDRVLPDGIEPLVHLLLERGHTVVAPVVRDRVITLAEISSPDDLATGWSDEQSPGRYRASPGGTTTFGHAAPNLPWRRWLRPADEVVVRVRRTGDGLAVDPVPPPAPLAFVGIQACDLAAVARLETVFAHDATFRARRERLVVVAAACTDPASTCFCSSVGTGPTPGDGADVVVRELADGTVLADGRTERGHALLDELGSLPFADDDQIAAADARIAAGEARQSRRLDPSVVAAAAASLDSAGWDRIADRCLTCGNCTLVCPTCFCTSVVDSTSLDGQVFERRERPDSCFGLDFSYVFGGAVRASAASRYRQWYLHKLVTWHDQFGESGCVGCGRCITWCPTGIDITEAIVDD